MDDPIASGSGACRLRGVAPYEAAPGPLFSRSGPFPIAGPHLSCGDAEAKRRSMPPPGAGSGSRVATSRNDRTMPRSSAAAVPPSVASAWSCSISCPAVA
jgi:hypothetical protein